jgi:hypothetical protein
MQRDATWPAVRTLFVTALADPVRRGITSAGQHHAPMRAGTDRIIEAMEMHIARFSWAASASLIDDDATGTALSGLWRSISNASGQPSTASRIPADTRNAQQSAERRPSCAEERHFFGS